MTNYTILVQNQSGLTRLVQYPISERVTLQVFTRVGMQEVELLPEELRAFLCALPEDRLLDAIKAKELLPDDDAPAGWPVADAVHSLQSCGHPLAALRGGEKGGYYCLACTDGAVQAHGHPCEEALMARTTEAAIDAMRKA